MKVCITIFGGIRSTDGRTTQVIVHDTILASAVDLVPATARRMAALFALDALEGDLQFMSKTCNCRANKINNSKSQKKALGYDDEMDNVA